MDIDLLFTREHESGLISTGNLVKKVAGVVLDTSSGLITLEYVDSDFMEMNIPLDPLFYDFLDTCTHIHIGAVTDGTISQAYQTPLMFADDPYRSEYLGRSDQSTSPLQAFDYFVRRCIAGQPVYRDDLSDESSAGCVLGNASPVSLQFAPHLAKRHALETGIRRSPTAAPRMGGPGPAAGMSGGGYITPPTQTGRNSKDSKE